MDLEFTDEPARLPARGARGHRRAASRRHPHEGRALPRARQGRLPPLAGHTGRTGLARLFVARWSTAGRAGRRCRATSSRRRWGARGRRGSSPSGRRWWGPVIWNFGSEAQKAKYLPAIARNETWWCQGYSGAGRRVRSGEPAHPRGPRRRPLRRRRDQDLDHRRALGGHDVLPRSHRYRGQAAGRDLLPAHRHARSGGRGPAHRHHGRGPGDQHRLPHGREGAGGEPHRRGEPGLDLRQVPAGTRALRHRTAPESKARLSYLGRSRAATASAARCSRTTPTSCARWRRPKSS